MKHNRSKRVTLFAFCFLLVNVAYGQSEGKAEKTNTIRIDTRNIANELSNLFKTVAVEIKKIDFEMVGAAISIVAEEVGREVENIEREVGDIEIIINQRSDPEQPEPQGGFTGTAEKTRIISKTYAIDKNDKLAINNQFGKVIVHTWAKNEIKVNVEIKAFEATDNDATKLLETVNIVDSRTDDLISFKTTFEKTSMNVWSRIKNGQEERRGVQVNYEIYMPAKNALEITNRYGNTVVPEFTGPVNINSSYGSFTAGKLNNPANQVNVSYGSASMEDYSNGNLSVSYGSLKLVNAEKLNATIKYSGAKIGKLSNSGNFELAYASGFKIDAVDKNVKNLNINSSYSGVTLGIDENAHFNYDVTVSYAGFNYNDPKMNLTSQLTDGDKSKSWNPTKNYKGTVGKGSDAKITIKSNYGGVKFL